MDNRKLLLGVGIGIIISSIVLYIAVICFNQPLLDKVVEVKMNDEQIIQKAKELGMIFSEEISSNNESELPDEKIIEKAKQLGMIFETNESTQNIEASTDNELLSKTENKDNVEVVDVYIPIGSKATNVSEILYNLLLIENRDEFISYIQDKKKSSKIRAGNFQINKGSSYEDILDILTATPK